MPSQPQAPQDVSTVDAPAKKSGLGLIILIIVVLLGAAGAAGAYYAQMAPQ
jgi:flagellar basal body-associated protein FliL